MSQLNQKEVFEEDLRTYSLLTSLGKLYPLDIVVSPENFLKELNQIESLEWIQYNKTKPQIDRKGLSLFSLDGGTDGEIDLNSLREYNDKHGTKYNESSFKVSTRYWDLLPSISDSFKDIAPNLRRSHLIKFGDGGYFPSHRDIGNCFRLISFLSPTLPGDLHFILDDHRVSYEQNRIYFFDARLTHSIFNMSTESIILVLNVELTRDSVSFVYRNLLYK